jgi:hypothetical protein
MVGPCADAVLANPIPSNSPTPSHLGIMFFPLRFQQQFTKSGRLKKVFRQSGDPIARRRPSQKPPYPSAVSAGKLKLSRQQG